MYYFTYFWGLGRVYGLGFKPLAVEFRAAAALGCRRALWGFPKLRGTFVRVLIIRTIVFWGPYWVPSFWETTI